MKNRRWISAQTLCGALLCLATVAAQAQDTFRWEFPVSGDFNDKNKWASFPPYHAYPVAGDFVIINAGSGYTVNCKGAASGHLEAGGHFTLQLDGAFDAGDLALGGGVVLRGGGTLTGTPVLLGSNGLADEYDVLVDGAGLTMNGLDLSSTIRMVGRNGAKIISSGLTDRNGTRPLLESGAEWQHAGKIYGSLCTINSGALLSADEMDFSQAELDGGRLQSGPLVLGRLKAKNGAVLSATTANLGASVPVVLEGGGTRMTISGALGAPFGNVVVRGGALLSVGSLASAGSSFYFFDGSGSQLAVASSVDRAIITMTNQAQGSAASMTRSSLTIRDAGSLFNVSDRFVDSIVTVQNGARVNSGLGLGSGFSVDGMGSVVVLSGILNTSPSGALASVGVSGGGRLDCAAAAAGGSVYGADSLWRVGNGLVGNGLVVGDKEEVYLNLGDGGRVEVHGSALALGFGKNGKGNLIVDGGGSLPSPSVLDLRQVVETGVGVAGEGLLRVNRRGRILASKLTVGVENGSKGTLEVFGLGTSLELGDTLEIGRAGSGLMTVDGGLVTTPEVVVGSNSGTNLLRLSGSGSTVTVADRVRLGKSGNGQLTIQQGAQLVLTGVFVDPNPKEVGLCEVSSGYGTGTVTVDGAGSALRGVNAFLAVGLTGKGNLTVTAGGTVDFAAISIFGGQNQSSTGSISGAGSVVQARDSLGIGSPFPGPELDEVTVSAGGLLKSKADFFVGRTGTLRLSGGSCVVGQTAEAPIPGTVLVATFGRFYLGGRLIGSVLVRPGGQLLPGSSPGHAAVEGNVTFAAGTSLEMELGGQGAGTGFDQIEATGTVTLGGRLDFVFRDGFAPTNGQSFELVRGGAVTGSFSEVNVAGLAPGFTYTLVNSGGTSLVLTATSTGVATSRPKLTIVPSSGTNVVVSWPGYITGWNLQKATGLPAGSWQPVTTQSNMVTLPASVGSGFFRLSSPRALRHRVGFSTCRPEAGFFRVDLSDASRPSVHIRRAKTPTLQSGRFADHFRSRGVIQS